MNSPDGQHAEQQFTPSWKTTFKARLTEWSWQLKRLVDIMQGPGAMSRTATAWIMGVEYGRRPQPDEEDQTLRDKDMQLLLADFRSHVWCTYRREFVPLGPDGLVSDVGWGCTLRSGQMLLAEAVLRHMLGRAWRHQSWSSPNSSHSQEQLMQVLSALLDHPQASLSIHRICAAGQPHGVVPGRWLGPWVLCNALASLVNSTPQLGLRLHVVCDPGGGAPSLSLSQLLDLMHSSGQQGAKGNSQLTTQGSAGASSSQLQSQLALSPGLDDDSVELQAVAPAPAAAHHSMQVQGSVATHAGQGGLCSQAAPQAVGRQEYAGTRAQQAVERAELGQHQGEQAECLLQTQHQESSPASPAATADGAQVEQACRAASDDKAMLREQSWEPIVASPSVVRNLACSPSDSPLLVATWQQQQQEMQQQQQQQRHGSLDHTAVGQPASSQAILQDADAGAGVESQASTQSTVSLVLLLPLTLGVGKTNPVYYPQLLRVLTFPQSIGIVGGRPSASLYFVGHQEQQLMYLDPHVPQPSGMQPSTYFCDTIRLLPITSIDPSLAIGFYCRTSDDVVDLVQRLEALNRDFDKAPIVTVASGTAAANSSLANGRHHAGHSSDAGEEDQSWEML